MLFKLYTYEYANYSEVIDIKEHHSVEVPNHILEQSQTQVLSYIISHCYTIKEILKGYSLGDLSLAFDDTYKKLHCEADLPLFYLERILTKINPIKETKGEAHA